jgi:hypothetical protein
MLETIRRQSAGPMAWRSRRFLLAYGYAAAVAVAAASPLLLASTPAAVVQLVAFVAMAGLWFGLRRATRLVADAPEEALDELVVRLRNRAFVLAYQLLAVVAMLVAFVLFVGGRSGIGEPLATALGWAAFGCAIGLPLVVTAVGFPDREAQPDAKGA